MGKAHRNVAIRYVYTAADREVLDQLDAIVLDACCGERRAVGALAVAFGPTLLKEVRKELGALFEQDAADVLQDYFIALLDGRLSFPPIRGAALPWMKRTVRTFAQEHLRRRATLGDAG